MPYNTFTLTASAKLNLFLHITGKRADGYHLLQSLMVFVDIGDTLSFAPHDSLFIDVEGRFGGSLTDPQDNLIYKAARILAEEYKTQPRGKIILDKKLPVASGMAGGSADAAAALKGLSRLWGLPEEPDRLRRIAEKLGADVPACLGRKTVWAEGVGEKMTPLPGMPDMHFILVNPLIETPTAEVFKIFRDRGRYSPAIQFMGRRKTQLEWIADLKMYHNDLTDAAIQVTPEIATILQAIDETAGCHFSRLSGSGATCFGVYDNQKSAAAAVNKLRMEHPQWWTVASNIEKN